MCPLSWSLFQKSLASWTRTPPTSSESLLSGDALLFTAVAGATREEDDNVGTVAFGCLMNDLILDSGGNSSFLFPRARFGCAWVFALADAFTFGELETGAARFPIATQIKLCSILMMTRRNYKNDIVLLIYMYIYCKNFAFDIFCTCRNSNFGIDLNVVLPKLEFWHIINCWNNSFGITFIAKTIVLANNELLYMLLLLNYLYNLNIFW